MTITVSNPFKLNVSGTSTWIPPYDVPTAPGEVIPIGGITITDSNEGIRTGAYYGQTTFVRNTNSSVSPGESLGTQILVNNDTSCQFIASYSQGGAIVTAGGGGHVGRMNLGAILFDFQDGLWKRIWTGGVTDANASNNYIDNRSGTKVHNVLHRQSEIVPYYDNSCGRQGCQNPAHWTPSAFQLQCCPLTSNPNDQTWEISQTYDPNLGATHLFPDPANWGGLGRETKRGYILPGGFFVDPSPAGTLAPTQSSLPLPSHTWDLMFELRPEDGGGPKGSIVCARHRNGGPHGQISLSWSQRFDLDTGIWHYASTNSSFGALGNPAGGEPYPHATTTAGAYDPVGKRYFMIDQNQLYTSDSGNRLNYWNASDQTWRNLNIGSSTGVVDPSAIRTENLMCDPDRRLLVMMSNEITGPDGPRIRVADLRTISGHADPNAILVSGTGGFVDVLTGNWPFKNPFSGSYIGDYNIPFVYYPPNGKYYRFISRIHGGDPDSGRPDGLTTAQYWADPTKCNSDKLQRITPPPIIANPPPGYYTSPTNWTLDEITLNRPIPRGCLTQSQRSVGLKWFKYVPALECLAWVPLNSVGSEPTARRPVYLIKPF